MIPTWTAGGGLNAGLSFWAPLGSTLVPNSSAGSATPTFTRATTATFPDFEGRRITSISGEARFSGVRYVKNLLTNTQTFAGFSAASTATFTAQNATDPEGGNNAGTLSYGATGRFLGDGLGVAFPATYAWSVKVRTTSGTVTTNLFLKETASDTSRGTTSFTATTTWQRIYATGTTTGAFCRLEIGDGGAGPVNGVLQIADPQLENISGQTYQQSQEFQSVALLSAPYQGLNADGAKAYEVVPSAISIWGDSLSTIKTPNGIRNLYESVPVWVHDGGVGGDTSTQIKTRMLAAPSQFANATVIWAGRNNFTAPTTVKADIAAMIAALGHTRYVVLSVLNADFSNEYTGQPDYVTLTTLNSDLAALYPNNFLDVRNPLVALFDPNTLQDVIDHGHDVPPSTIRIDNVHLTPTGYNFVAGLIKKFIDGKGWSLSPTAISPSTLLGYLVEASRTNNVLWCRDFTNAAWVKTTMTAALDQVGIDGKANGASSLLATGANATAAQTVTIAAVNRPFGIYIKRLVGTGNVDISQDGAAFTTQTLGSGWTRCTLIASQLNPVLTIRLATSGDKIAVDYASLESGAGAIPSAGSPIATTTVAVTRNADVLTYAIANASGTAGTAYAEVTRDIASSVTDGTAKAIVGGNTSNHFLYYQSANGFLTLFDGTTATQIAVADSANTTYKVASRWSGSATGLIKNGGAVTTGSFDGDMNATAVSIGNAGASNFLNGNVRNVRVWTRALADSQFVSLTS